MNRFYLHESARASIAAPRQTPLDLPIITGVKDSANAALEPAIVLDRSDSPVPAFTFDGPSTNGGKQRQICSANSSRICAPHHSKYRQ